MDMTKDGVKCLNVYKFENAITHVRDCKLRKKTSQRGIAHPGKNRFNRIH